MAREAERILRPEEDARGGIAHRIPWPWIIATIGEPIYRALTLSWKPAAGDLSKVKRVLVVRLDEIGDVVMTTPFLRELRRNACNAWITLVVNSTVSNLVELCPRVNEILKFDWDAPKPRRSILRSWRALKLALRHLWWRRFELGILPRWDFDRYHGTYLMYFSGARSRVAYSENVTTLKKLHNRGFDTLITHRILDDSLKHEVEQNLEVIRFLGGEVLDNSLELWLTNEDEIFADEVVKRHNLRETDLLVGLGVGAGSPKRRWPVDRYVELCRWLQMQYQAKLVIVGGPGEELLGNEFEREFGSLAINTVGKITLRESAALLKRASLYIGNDAGPMHLAAAVGLPVVEISCHPKDGSPYSPNAPQRFHPWCNDYVVIQPQPTVPECHEECVADHPHCILGIAVDEVMAAVSRLFPLRARHESGLVMKQVGG